MFERVGDITVTHFEMDWLHAKVDVKHDGPCVYLWVEEPADSAPAILYIGKAGSTLARRCYQHAQGFRGANRGKSHADELIPKLKSGSTIGIYAHWPDPVPFMGEMIPSHSSVEDWLLSVTTPKPARNR